MEQILSNKELLSRAVDMVKEHFQDVVIYEMKMRYGQEWWGVVLENNSKIGVFVDAPKTKSIDDDVARSYMDIIVCYNIIRLFNLTPNDKKMGLRDDNYNAKDLRNHLGHLGKNEIGFTTANREISAFIDIANRLGLKDLEDSLSELLDTLYENKKRIDDLCKKNTSETDSDAVKKSADSKTNMPSNTKSKGKTTDEVVHQAPSTAPMFNISEIAVNACKSYLEEVKKLRDSDPKKNKAPARSLFKANIEKSMGDRYQLVLKKGLYNADQLGVMVNGKDYGYDKVRFDNYNDVTKTIDMYCYGELEEAMKNGPKNITVYNDLDWLVGKTASFFEDYGDFISYPPEPNSLFGDVDLTRIDMGYSDEQDLAVKMSLTKPLSYVWGIPGSGKTQAVLARSIYECVSRGEKVLVIAPTNNSIEQVIRGLVKAFSNSKDISKTIRLDKDILRIGIPTDEFMKEYPNLCDSKGVQKKLIKKMDRLCNLKLILMKRSMKSHKDDFKKIVDKASGMKGEAASKEIFKEMLPILKEMNKRSEYEVVVRMTNEDNILSNIRGLYNLVYGNERSEGDVADFSDSDISDLIAGLTSDIDKMKRDNPSCSIDDAKIIVMTLTQFIIKYGPSAMNGRHALNVDHIFVDEAGYCNVLNMLTLFTMGVPITMLGDHMQLPPVCVFDRDDLLIYSMDEDISKYDFLWDMSALYVDMFFDKDMSLMHDAYRNDLEPSFRYTAKQDLTISYRFGKVLADVLGKNIYGMELKSNADDPLKIEIIDAKIDEFPFEDDEYKRVNSAEVDAVVKYVYDNGYTTNDSFIILTPYNDQLSSIRHQLRKNMDSFVTNIHRSQGREWDTVIFSVCDGGANPEEKPRRFTSTKLEMSGTRPGFKVMNTAISRVKKKLVIVCDVEYWFKQEGELICDLIRIAE